MIHRKIKILSISIAMLLICTAIYSFQNKPKRKIYNIGIISGSEMYNKMIDGFKSRLAELGCVESQNIKYEVIKTNASSAAAKKAAEKFVSDDVDLIFSISTGASTAAKEIVQKTNIPLLFAGAGIEENNLVKSISRPGGNITGARYPGPEITAKRLEMLAQCVAKLKNVLIIYDPNYPMAHISVAQLCKVSSQMSINLVEVHINHLKDIQTSLQKIENAAANNIDAILIMPELLTQTEEGFSMIADFADKHKIPIGGSSQNSIGRTIFTYNADYSETGKLCAEYAKKILDGQNAGQMMVITPPLYLRINYKKARELGLNIPEGLLNQACEIIK